MRLPEYERLNAASGFSVPIGDQTPVNCGDSTIGVGLIDFFVLTCPPKGFVLGDPQPPSSGGEVGSGDDIVVPI